jgi:hypothetical protein
MSLWTEVKSSRLSRRQASMICSFGEAPWGVVRREAGGGKMVGLHRRRPSWGLLGVEVTAQYS